MCAADYRLTPCCRKFASEILDAIVDNLVIVEANLLIHVGKLVDALIDKSVELAHIVVIDISAIAHFGILLCLSSGLLTAAALLLLMLFLSIGIAVRLQLVRDRVSFGGVYVILH